MNFPDEKTLKKMLKKLEEKPGFQMLSPDASELQKMRFSICQDLLKYAKKNDLTSSDLADILEIPKADMSRIFNHRIERFSTDKLLRLYSIVFPDYKLKVS